ncbi:hypothetical protein ACOSQ2_017304 [Xanthoceras sorbifolium]
MFSPLSSRSAIAVSGWVVGRVAHYPKSTFSPCAAHRDPWSRCSLSKIIIFTASYSSRSLVAMTGRGAHYPKLTILSRAAHHDPWWR